MITEEEFKSLTEDLETVGHYTPSVRDMFRFLVEKKGYMRVDPENPKAWKGYAMVKVNKGEPFNLGTLEYFPEAGRFEAAIEEILTSNNAADDLLYREMARKEFGLDLQLTSTSFTAQFVVSLPVKELVAEHEKYKTLTK